MKYFYSIIGLSIFFSSAYGHSYLDSSESHPYIKLTSYPFLYPKENPIVGSFALGPSVSVSGEHFEMQVGVLYDVQQYKYIEHLSPGQVFILGMTPDTIKFHNYYLPLEFNYYFILSKKIKWYATLGGGLIIPNPDDSKGWLFAGGGISYKASDEVKLNLSIHERLATGGLSQGAFFEIAFRLK